MSPVPIIITKTEEISGGTKAHTAAPRGLRGQHAIAAPAAPNVCICT